MKMRILVFIVVVTLALMPLAATSQGMPPMPATPVPGEAPVGTLAEFNLRHLPTPHAEVWFFRMEVEPGGTIPMGEDVGPMVIYIEAGELALETEGPVMMPGADRAEEPGDLTMATGDSVFLTAETSASMENAADVPVTFLVLMMYPAMEEGEGDEGMAEPVGMSQMGISVGTAEFMDVPATVRIERVVIEPGETVEPEMAASDMDMPGYMGMELGAVESGTADVALETAGMSHLKWPGMLEGQMAEPEIVTFTSTVQLQTGDAYAFHASTLAWTVTGDEPLTVLRVVIVPMPMPMQ